MVGLSLDDIFFCAILAIPITIIVNTLINFKKFLTQNSREFNYPSKEIEKIMERCYQLFPIEIFQFKGKSFKRGTEIKITTLQNRIFQGELIGVNNKEVVCLLTNRHIVAHEIKNIKGVEENEEILVNQNKDDLNTGEGITTHDDIDKEN